MNYDIREILIRANINPNTVLNVIQKENIICTWCQRSCGHLAILSPCNHKICLSCLDNIVDSKREICPHCFINIISYTTS